MTNSPHRDVLHINYKVKYQKLATKGGITNSPQSDAIQTHYKGM